MKNAIQVKKEFPAAIDKVFELLSKHDAYNVAFAPMQVERIKDSADKPLKEQITLLEPNSRIEYKIVKNPLIKHHLGIIEFEALDDNKSLVTYTIELQARLPFVSKLILAQLKTGIKLGLAKLAKSV